MGYDERRIVTVEAPCQRYTEESILLAGLARCARLSDRRSWIKDCAVSMGTDLLTEEVELLIHVRTVYGLRRRVDAMRRAKIAARNVRKLNEVLNSL